MSRFMAICVVCGGVAAFSAAATAETIYLKSGEKVTGKIVAQSAKSTMIQDASGAYFSYAADEIKEIKKESVAKQSTIKVAEKPSVPDQVSYLLSSREGAIKITLPRLWQKFNASKEVAPDSVGAFTICDKQLKPLAMLNIEISYFDGYKKKKTNELKKQFLQELNDGVKITERQDTARNRISEEYSELLGVPCLIVSYKFTKNTRVAREVHLIKGTGLYFISFIANDAERFDKEWPDVEQALKAMEFQAKE